jgi:hypothetical protein
MSRRGLDASSFVFEENHTKRTQEFVLRWSPDGGRSFREIVRQQWNFSPPETVREVQEYQVELSDVTVPELIIIPDISGGTAPAPWSRVYACLDSLRDEQLVAARGSVSAAP